MVAGIEIERKFLVIGRPDHAPDKVHKIRQGYVARENGNTVRIRQKNNRYILSVKANHKGIGRHELEYEIPEDEGEILFSILAHEPIEKTREIYRINGMIWELDIFAGANAGLMLAEVELESEDQHVQLPDWVGPEVTGLSKFYNANIATTPFSTWGITYQGLMDRMR